MANIASAQNTDSDRLDPLVLVSSGAAKLKRAVPGSDKTASGVTPNTAAMEVGTHVDDAAFGVATDTVSVAGALADDTSPDSVHEGDAGALRMTLSRLLKTVSTADAAALTQVNSSNVSQTILAANVNRIGAMVENTDANVLYLAFTSSAATSTAYTVSISSGEYYEFPEPVYRGQVTGIWSADGSGAAVITELT